MKEMNITLIECSPRIVSIKKKKKTSSVLITLQVKLLEYEDFYFIKYLLFSLNIERSWPKIRSRLILSITVCRRGLIHCK